MKSPLHYYNEVLPTAQAEYKRLEAEQRRFFAEYQQLVSAPLVPETADLEALNQAMQRHQARINHHVRSRRQYIKAETIYRDLQTSHALFSAIEQGDLYAIAAIPNTPRTQLLVQIANGYPLSPLEYAAEHSSPDVFIGVLRKAVPTLATTPVRYASPEEGEEHRARVASLMKKLEQRPDIQKQLSGSKPLITLLAHYGQSEHRDEQLLRRIETGDYKVADDHEKDFEILISKYSGTVKKRWLEMGARYSPTSSYGFNQLYKKSLGGSILGAVAFQADQDEFISYVLANYTDAWSVNLADDMEGFSQGDFAGAENPLIVEAFLKINPLTVEKRTKRILRAITQDSPRDNPKILEVLWDDTMDVNAYHSVFDDVSKHTLLHLAAKSGLTNISKWLLAKGADVNAVAKEEEGYHPTLDYLTPLCYATGYPDTISVLLNHGATTSVFWNSEHASAPALSPWEYVIKHNFDAYTTAVLLAHEIPAGSSETLGRDKAVLEAIGQQGFEPLFRRELKTLYDSRLGRPPSREDWQTTPLAAFVEHYQEAIKEAARNKFPQESEIVNSIKRLPRLPGDLTEHIARLALKDVSLPKVTIADSNPVKTFVEKLNAERVIVSQDNIPKRPREESHVEAIANKEARVEREMQM